MTADTLSLSSFPSSETFSHAAASTLKFLTQKIPFKLWMVTRLTNEQQIIIETNNDKTYGIQKGDQIDLSDTFCTHMVKGQGPHIATNPAEIPVYANSPSFKKMNIGSYIGVPIHLANGSLYGTLCAIDTDLKEEKIKDELAMIQTFADMLGGVMDLEIKMYEQSIQSAKIKSESILDSVTKLYNQSGWEFMTASEEMRARQYGHSLCIISIDLDNLKKINDTQGHTKGTEYIAKAGKAIKESIRPYDIGSRTGGDEFNILLAECDDVAAEKIIGDMKRCFDQYGVSGSFGLAQLKYGETLAQTLDRADQKMYEDKRMKKVAHGS